MYSLCFSQSFRRTDCGRNRFHAIQDRPLSRPRPYSMGSFHFLSILVSAIKISSHILTGVVLYSLSFAQWCLGFLPFTVGLVPALLFPVFSAHHIEQSRLVHLSPELLCLIYFRSDPALPGRSSAILPLCAVYPGAPGRVERWDRIAAEHGPR